MKIAGENIIYSFSAVHKPVAIVPAGQTLEFETKDCFCNQLRNPEDTIESLDWDRVNPATGPVFIEGAEPGDLLKVKIEEMVLDQKGTVVSGEGFGTLGHLLKGSHTRIVNIENGHALFADNIKLPLRKMIGVIGVAPEKDDINTGTPGTHGGNMDNTMITEGATLYFPVKVPGALFALGDVHAVMGDGEIGVSGLEIPAKIRVTVDVVKNYDLPCPLLENEEVWSFIASEATLDETAVKVTENMFNFLKAKVKLTEPEIVMLMSLVGDMQICQVVDPMKTLRFNMPKKFLPPIVL